MDENNLQEPVNAPVERETTELGNSGPGKQTLETPIKDGVAGGEAKDLSEIANLQAAMRETRGKNKSYQEKVRQLERKLAEYETKQKTGQYAEGEYESVMSHPEVFKLYTENAEYKLKDHVGDVLKSYPDFPKDVAAAIRKNPRGWINSETRDIETAKIDIEEAIESYYQQWLEGKNAELSPAVPDTRLRGKSPKVAGTNATGAVKTAEEQDIEGLMEKSPLEWTPDEIKILEKYQKSHRG